jgi:hypothetical protein
MADIEPIVELHGTLVMINRESRSVIIVQDGYMPPIKFHIDHPDIQGSRLERDARLALDGPSGQLEF